MSVIAPEYRFTTEKVQETLNLGGIPEEVVIVGRNFGFRFNSESTGEKEGVRYYDASELERRFELPGHPVVVEMDDEEVVFKVPGNHND